MGSFNIKLVSYTIWRMCWLYTGIELKMVTKEAEEEFNNWRADISDDLFKKYMTMYDDGTLKHK